MKEFKTLAEAEEARIQLVTDIQNIQAQLGQPGKPFDWRERAKHAHRMKLEELREVKAWIKNYHTNPDIGIASPGAVTVTEATNAIRLAMNTFCDFVWALERENKRLAAENNGLRATVARLTDAGQFAPGDGVDVWRDGYTMADARPTA